MFCEVIRQLGFSGCNEDTRLVLKIKTQVRVNVSPREGQRNGFVAEMAGWC